MKNQVAVIVDGISTGMFFAKKLQNRGIKSVHVCTLNPIPAVVRSNYHPEDYIENINYHGSLDDLLLALQKYSVALVVPGCEAGVIVSDNLSRRLGLPANGIATTEARRNKFLMNEAVRKFGVPVSEHFKSSFCAEILTWATVRDQWPVVIKPLNSTGTENVFICQSREDITHAYDTIANHENFLGIYNTEVLAEEYLSGTEYIVNTVTQNGVHYLSDLWVYHKIKLANGCPIYEYTKILSYNEQYRELVDYTFAVLDALEIKCGASHSEIMLTAKGPRLIESGARVMGHLAPDIIDMALGYNQIDLMLDSYVNPVKFQKEINKTRALQKHLMYKFLISRKEGKICKINHLDTIRNLPSFYKLILSKEVGDNLVKTKDLFTLPGEIILLNADEKILLEDYKKIVSLEDDIFEV